MKNLAILMVSMVIFACASQTAEQSPPSDVLEQVDETTTSEVGAEATSPIESPVPAAFEALKAKLDALGYEGVGLEHETIESIERLIVVFSDPAAARRKIKAIYTGAANDYDPTNESVTLSGSADAKGLLVFLKKKVPLKRRTK